MQVQIKFTTNGANSAFGGFTAGDTMRVSVALGKHLVEEMGCAKYIVQKAVENMVDAGFKADEEAAAKLPEPAGLIKNEPLSKPKKSRGK